MVFTRLICLPGKCQVPCTNQLFTDHWASRCYCIDSLCELGVCFACKEKLLTIQCKPPADFLRVRCMVLLSKVEKAKRHENHATSIESQIAGLTCAPVSLFAQLWWLAAQCHLVFPLEPFQQLIVAPWHQLSKIHKTKSTTAYRGLLLPLYRT